MAGSEKATATKIDTFPILSTWRLPRPVDWLQIINQPQTEAEMEALRCCVNRGLPLGDPDWIAHMAKRLYLQWTLRPRGKAKKQE
jgi:putative transposase